MTEASKRKPARKRHPGTRRISGAEVARAIFVDYECSKDRAPTLLGFRIDGENRAGIVEEAFHRCAGKYRVKHTFEAEHGELLRELIERAEGEDRRIISWSTFDYDHMVAALGPDEEQRAQLDAHYRNAIPTALAWRKLAHPTLREPNTLGSYADRLRIHIPERFAAGIVGSGLRLMRPQLESDRDYAALTPSARAAWLKIVRHNTFDLQVMEAVLGKATAMLEQTRP